MAKTLSRFYTLAKDKDKDKAYPVVRVQDPVRRIDVQFTSHLRVGVQEWKTAVSSEDALARHRKEYPKLHDMLGRIEIMLKREMDAPKFDREKIKSEILAIAKPDKSEILRRQREAEIEAQQKEERERAEQEAAEKKAADEARAKHLELS